MRRISIGIALLWVASIASVASATVVAFQDTATTPGNTITYTLDFTGVPNGTATLTIQNSANVSPAGGELYVGDIIVHMDGGTPINITAGLVPNPTWLVTDVDTNSSQKLIGGGDHLNQSARQGGFGGFYSTAVASLPGSFTGLLCVTCAPAAYTFPFSYTGASTGGTSGPISFQAIYYNGIGSNPEFETILSEHLSSAVSPAQVVPEPGTLLLIGSGLAAVGLRLRRARRTVSDPHPSERLPRQQLQSL